MAKQVLVDIKQMHACIWYFFSHHFAIAPSYKDALLVHKEENKSHTKNKGYVQTHSLHFFFFFFFKCLHLLSAIYFTDLFSVKVLRKATKACMCCNSPQYSLESQTSFSLVSLFLLGQHGVWRFPQSGLWFLPSPHFQLQKEIKSMICYLINHHC